MHQKNDRLKHQEGAALRGVKIKKQKGDSYGTDSIIPFMNLA
ncbi:hypothetical protein [Lacrimispora sphenoides]|nr:hypothetical protein [Lacrimispora sphenoides]